MALPDLSAEMTYLNPGSLIAFFSIIMFLIVWARNKRFPSSSRIIYVFVSGTIVYGIISSVYFVLTGEFIFGDRNQYKLMAGLSALIYLWLFVNEIKTLGINGTENKSGGSILQKLKIKKPKQDVEKEQVPEEV